MVKTQGPSEYDRLDTLIEGLCEKHGFRLSMSGWTRKTYDIFERDDGRAPSSELLARIESFATTNGEIRIYDARAMQFATELGTAIENEFEVEEAVVLQLPRPE